MIWLLKVSGKHRQNSNFCQILSTQTSIRRWNHKFLQFHHGTSVPRRAFRWDNLRIDWQYFTNTFHFHCIWKRVVSRKLKVKFAAFKPMRASSLLPLPAELLHLHCLLNIRNPGDSNCFLYCFIAAWHFNYGPVLFGWDKSWRVRTNPQTYSHLTPWPVNRLENIECPCVSDNYLASKNWMTAKSTLSGKPSISLD